MHRRCEICMQPIVLRPSAEERARRYGGVPSDYLNMFTTHAGCALRKRMEETRALIERNYPTKE